MEAFVRRLSGLRPDRILDIASGPGRSTAGLMESTGSTGWAAACDIDDDILRRGLEFMNETGDISPVCADSRLLPFRGCSFGLVGISNSLHHMEDLEETLNGMIDVLEPGGWFLVREMYRDGQTETQMSHVLLHDWWADIDQAAGRPHYSTFWREEILGFLKELGLEDTSMADHAELDQDPLAPEGLERVNDAIEVYVKKAVGLHDFEELRSRGDELRRRVHSVGIHGASGLMFLGRKPG